MRDVKKRDLINPLDPGAPLEQVVDVPPLTLRADISVAAEDRTAEVVFTAGAAVQRFDWMTGTRYLEVLSLDPDHVRMGRLTNGAPFLNAHRSYGLEDILGVVESASLEKKRGVATVRFSRRADVEPFYQDVRDKIVRNVSVGYRVHAYEETPPKKQGGLPTRTAVDWEPYEISAVPMGADDGAKIRSENPDADKVVTNRCRITMRGAKESLMNETTAGTTEEATRTVPDEVVIDPTDPGRPAAPTIARTAAAEPTEADRATERERARVQGITRACRAGRLPASFADELIAAGISLLDAQTRILDAIGANEDGAGGPRVTASRASVETDPHVNMWRGMENALSHRVAPSLFKLDDNGRTYRGLTLMEMAKICLQARGVRTTGMSKMEVAGLALGLNQRGGMHSTSDYANLLADVANKTLRRAYEEAPQTYQPFSRRVTLPDFKLAKRLQLGEAPSLQALTENGEYTRGTIGEGKEQFQLATYGRIFAIGRKALINDDTDSFSRLTMLFGRAARDLESNLVWVQITSNPTMGDGVALFHATHANLSGSSDAIAIASIGAGRAAMRAQKGLDGVQYINIVPRFLAVPVGKETIADQFVSTNLVASASTSVNPFAGKLQVIAEPRLDAASATAWYLFASPDQTDVVEYAFLEGEEGPVVESRIGFDVDGLEIKARHDFAAKAIDWRGMWKNPGA
jgi:hypothetical protein